MATVRHSSELRLRAPVRAAWAIVSDTDAIDAAAGLPAVEYDERPQPDGTTRRLFHYRLRGLPVRGEELPFTWLAPRFFEVVRTYERGPFSGSRHRCTVDPIDPRDPDAGAVVRQEFELEPRGLLGRLFAFGFGKEVLPAMERWILARDAEGTRAPELQPTSHDAGHGPSAVQRAALQRLGAELLTRVPGPATEALIELLREGADDEVERLRPYGLADRLGLSRRDALRLCLRATRAGLLRLRWDVICPHCRGDKQNLESLDELQTGAYCASCNLDFSLDLDRGVEAVFTPHPQVRSPEVARYCLGGPGATPHIAYQKLLAPGERWEPELDLPAGKYRVRFTGTGEYRWIYAQEEEIGTSEEGDLSDLATLRAAVVQDDTLVVGPDGVEGADLIVPPERPTPATIENRSGRPLVVRVESVTWADDALPAGELIADQDFRDLFSKQMLAEGVGLAVESVTILFTDIVGSTAMYGELGDAAAFKLVWDHFDLLLDSVREHGGTVVKTIGDAVMAAFSSPEAALRTAADLHDRIREHIAEAGHEHPVALKVGLHRGPAIVVTLNERLDYFGSTVNLAARTEGRSRGGDIVLTEETAACLAEGLLDELRGRGFEAERFRGEAKGFEAPVPMLRLTRPPPGQ